MEERERYFRKWWFIIEQISLKINREHGIDINFIIMFVADKYNRICLDISSSSHMKMFLANLFIILINLVYIFIIDIAMFKMGTIEFNAFFIMICMLELIMAYFENVFLKLMNTKFSQEDQNILFSIEMFLDFRSICIFTGIMILVRIVIFFVLNQIFHSVGFFEFDTRTICIYGLIFGLAVAIVKYIYGVLSYKIIERYVLEMAYNTSKLNGGHNGKAD